MGDLTTAREGRALDGRIPVVTGATRGCGRAIAVELGRAGATVFVTGRSTRGNPSVLGRPETIEETAELVEAAGGRGLPVRCDFTSVADVDALVERVAAEGGLGVTEETWREAVTDERPEFAVSETPYYLARGVAALAADPDVSRFAGRTLASWTLARTYDLTDVDGSRPDFGRYYAEVFQAGRDPLTTDPAPYR